MHSVDERSVRSLVHGTTVTLVNDRSDPLPVGSAVFDAAVFGAAASGRYAETTPGTSPSARRSRGAGGTRPPRSTCAAVFRPAVYRPSPPCRCPQALVPASYSFRHE
ncbi:hypothetical protein GCM10009676_01480 [Prauserella halophila]|uniref:Uncharacterized protein n=1 Tax=Prauserella halophila TaxID=185641 RepID=A0ABN1VVR9_9PSEU